MERSFSSSFSEPQITKGDQVSHMGALNNLHWEELKPSNSSYAPSNRNCHTATLCGKYMIIFGGKEGEGKRIYVNDLHILDVVTNSWVQPLKTVGTPPEGRMGHTSCFFDENKMIIHGGWNGSKVLDDTWILHIHDFNTLQLEWEKMSPEGTAPKKQFHTSNMYLHYMYSFGGGDGKNWLNDMYQLDFQKNAWKQVETTGDKPLARLQHTSAINGSKVFVFGGEPDRQRQLNDLYCLELTTFEWSKLEPIGVLPSARVSTGAQSKGNKIFFFGGFDGSVWRNDMFTYNIDDNTWEQILTFGNKPKPRCRHTLVIHESRLIIFGGNDSEMSFSDLYALNLDIQLETKNSTLVQDLKQMFTEGLFCDVTFEVQGEKIPAHRAILAARCEQFKTMFQSQLKESSELEVKIPDIQPSVFKCLLEYIYSDQIILDDSIAANLLCASDKYLLPRLKNLCEQYISQRLSVKNIIETINLADNYDAQYLKECAFNFIISNREIICETQDISRLNKEILVDLFKKRLFK